MTRKVRNVVVIEPETDAVCEICGKVAELRPYGPNGERVCFGCAMQDEEAAKRQFLGILEGPGAAAQAGGAIPTEPTLDMLVAGDEAILAALNDHTFALKDETPALKCWQAMVRALRPSASADLSVEIRPGVFALATESEVMQHSNRNRSEPENKTPPLSASALAGASWRKMMKDDVLATIYEWYQDQKITLTEDQIDALAKEIAECIPSPDARNVAPAGALTESEAQAVSGLDRWQRHGGTGPFLSDVRIVLETIHRLSAPAGAPSEEQIARAICLASDGDPDDARMGKPFWQFYTEQARAVLALLQRAGK